MRRRRWCRGRRTPSCRNGSRRLSNANIHEKNLGEMMSDPISQPELVRQYLREVSSRLEQLAAEAQAGALDAAIDLLAGAIAKGGVVQAFGTGHSEAFAMEVAG